MKKKGGGGKKRTLLLAKDSWFPVDDLLQIDTVFTSAVKYVPLSPNIHALLLHISRITLNRKKFVLTKFYKTPLLHGCFTQ